MQLIIIVCAACLQCMTCERPHTRFLAAATFSAFSLSSSAIPGVVLISLFGLRSRLGVIIVELHVEGSLMPAASVPASLPHRASLACRDRNGHLHFTRNAIVHFIRNAILYFTISKHIHSIYSAVHHTLSKKVP